MGASIATKAVEDGYESIPGTFYACPLLRQEDVIRYKLEMKGYVDAEREKKTPALPVVEVPKDTIER